MDITKLQSFLVLAKAKSFAKASEVLYISQPALSKRIQSLEAELGVALFDRLGSGTFLTVHGEAFLEFAEKINAQYFGAKEYIKQIESMEFGTLNFGATNFIGIYIMPELIAKFHQKYPTITINMVINSSSKILDMLHNHQLEFILVSDYIHSADEQHESISILKDTLKLVVGNRHRLFLAGKCSVRELAEDLYITKEEHSSQYRFIKALLDEIHFDFEKKLYIGSQESIKECVINNVGVAIISEKAVAREIETGLLSALDIQELTIDRNIVYTYNKNRLLTPAAKEFIKILKGNSSSSS